jgi:hypothetical protein
LDLLIRRSDDTVPLRSLRDLATRKRTTKDDDRLKFGPSHSPTKR